ncbi:MAG TPA: squalene synthase HpnC [Candidatus Heimdallarchaeota archaeon]|nr:squalene synthase HpnC [Candidatus Heimdallarchaeota archaeon]
MVSEHIASLIERPTPAPSLSESSRLCTRLARTHYENFTVISRLVPRRIRVHLATLYAFCRTVDDIGDEAPGDRIELLDRFEAELHAAYDARPYHPVIVALQHTIHTYNLPAEPFSQLIEANRIDQEKPRYETFAELLHYCEHSANPVGRLFLMLYGYRDEERFALSDATCTALQLTNFWQDIKRDFAMGRIYLPEDEMRRFGVTEQDLSRHRAEDRVKELVRFQVARTRGYFEAGLPLIDLVNGHLKIDIALFSRGGLAILDKIKQQNYDTLSARPILAKKEMLGLFFSTLLSRRWKTWISR